jgi:predicted nuclease with TOPRIM domain
MNRERLAELRGFLEADGYTDANIVMQRFNELADALEKAWDEGDTVERKWKMWMDVCGKYGERIRYLEAENKRLLEEWNRLTGDLEMALDREWDAEEEIKRLREALSSIARNTCCDKCQEAALVAKQALEGKHGSV